MSIPYNDLLSLDNYRNNPNWVKDLQEPEPEDTNPAYEAGCEVLTTFFQEPFVRGVQLIRDAARLVLKVPVRAIIKPIIFEKNWQERERAGINAKLTGYAFIQLFSIPGKFIVALTALFTSAFSQEKAKTLLELSKKWTVYFDGRASQLEALKEEGAKKAQDRIEFHNYRTWLYTIDPQFCRKLS